MWIARRLREIWGASTRVFALRAKISTPCAYVGGGASTPRKGGTRMLLLASQAEVSLTLRLTSELVDLRVAKSNLIAHANNTKKRKTQVGELGSKPCHGAKKQGSICYPVFLAAALGFEPRDDGVRVRCLTAWRCRNNAVFSTAFMIITKKSPFVKGVLAFFRKSCLFFFVCAEEKAKKGAPVEGNERIKVAIPPIQGAIGDEQDGEKKQTCRKSPHAEERGEGKQSHAQELEGVPQLVILLGKGGDGAEGHIEDHLRREPTDLYGKVA